MSRFLSLATIVGLLCLPLKINAQYQTIELADVQLVKSLSAVIQDPVGSPLTNVLVQEFSPDWKTVLRTSATDDHGRFSLGVSEFAQRSHRCREDSDLLRTLCRANPSPRELRLIYRGNR